MAERQGPRLSVGMPNGADMTKAVSKLHTNPHNGKSSRYMYLSCTNCGQLVAHDKNGSVLHSHARSEQCRKNSKKVIPPVNQG